MTPVLFFLINLPLIAGAALLFIRRHQVRGNLAQLTLLLGLIASVMAFLAPSFHISIKLIGDYKIALGLGLPARLIIIFVNLFCFLVGMYSKDYEALKDKRAYFSYLLWLVAFSNLVCLSLDFLIFIFGWGATLVLLYAMLNLGSGYSATKALYIVGLGDFSLMLGISLYVFISGTTLMPEQATIYLNNPLNWCSFILMLLGAFAKAGCAPLHTWIPTAAESAPLPVMAILPASLDKLLGVYILARVCSGFFILSPAAIAILLVIGSSTIVFAVLLALIQHDLRKLLSYHAISQVGYMVLGIGTGTPLGMIGGLFHMVNNSIYKSGLFLIGGAVGQKKNTFELEKLGGLAAFMPVTFGASLIFCLAISGVPPLNGFASKWLIYQGVLSGISGASNLFLRLVYVMALAAAMFGSVLTLASFFKFIHAIFLGQRQQSDKSVITEVSVDMKIPLVVLAGLCVILGIFPMIFIKIFIQPWLGGNFVILGSYNSLLAFVLLALGFILGLILWQADKSKKTRPDSFFIGGEEPVFGPSFPATQFYRTLEEMPLLKRIFTFLKLESLDIYNVLIGLAKVVSFLLFIFIDRVIDILTMLTGRSVFGVSWLLRKLHTGNLDFYLAWSLVGLVVMFIILMVR